MEENAATVCPNCDCPEVQRFCPRCGQENVPSAVPVGEILLGFLDEFLKFDTKLWVTLRALITKPGLLTREYLAGRRARYVAPVKLYLAISFLAFLIFAFVPGESEKVNGISGFDRGSSLASLFPLAPRATPAPAPTPAPAAEETDQLRHRDACDDVVANERKKLAAREQEQSRQGWLSANQSTINLARLPTYALLLLWLFRRLKRLYVEHLIFVLHVESLSRLADIGQLACNHLLPPLAGVFDLVSLAYFYFACRRVYGQPARGTIGAMIGFFLLSKLADWVTGVSAGLIYRLTTPG